MLSKKRIIALLKKYKEEQADKFGIIRIGIFGSVARGSATENSDIDIVVELSKRNLFNRVGLQINLEAFLGRQIDVIVYREGLASLLKKRIKDEAIFV